MGKQRRPRKRQSNKDNKSGSKNHTTSTSNNTKDDESAAAPTSTLLQRIRHADPRTRHAALAAVANTLLDPQQQQQQQGFKLSKAVTPQLLQAIRERVLDSDLDVSQVAAACLANYVTLVAGSFNNNNNTNNNNSTATKNNSTNSTSNSQSTMMAGWILVVMGRLKQCHDNTSMLLVQPVNHNPATPTSTATNNGKKKKPPTLATINTNTTTKVHKQWLALAVQCLRTLCSLVETNPEAVARLTSHLDATPRQDFHQILLEWMHQCTTASTTILLVTPQQQNQPQPGTSDDTMMVVLESYYNQILTLAARTLHSAWDDNDDLLVPWQEECPDAFQRAVALMEHFITTTTTSPQYAAAATAATARNQKMVVAQLHCAGALLAARPFITTTTNNNNNNKADILPQTVLPLLLQHTNNNVFNWNTVQSLLQAYQQASDSWEQEQADDALERDVIRKVHDRHEPARQIAKRQKEQKKQQQQQQQEQNKNNVVEDEDDKQTLTNNDDDDNNKDEEMEEEDSGPAAEQQHKLQQQVETREALEQARDAWNQFLLPLQLSLELLANLTSGNNLWNENNDNDDDDMMMMDEDNWGPDQEAKWMQQEQQRQLQTSPPQNITNTQKEHKILLESSLPQQLRQLFLKVYQEQPNNDVAFPEKTRADLEDLQSKVMACLGNCWENIEGWPIDFTWTELQQTAAAATTVGPGMEGLVGAMVIALKKYPTLRQQWQPEHVAFWLNQLTDNNNHHKNSEAGRRDIVCMLGVLCSQEPHPVDVNQKICSALLAALDKNTSPLSACEVLNVLMDMYGNDEDDGCCHVSVFESMQVLSHFQRRIPTLKSELKQLEKNWKGNGDDSVDRAGLEHWKETLLNASRFVQYKKGQL
jgi:hypothetical protein